RLTRYRPPAEVAAGPMLQNGNWNFPDTPGQWTLYPPSEDTTAVRNDTGVFEGGEISMYYDPMIAKLCTWGPDRASAIAAMRGALDAFEVEGIGHNLPFVAAVMDHPKFISGDMTTAFIAEEYPEGFEGVELGDATLRQVAAAAAAMHRVSEIRRTRISGRMDNHTRVVGSESVVSLQGQSLAVTIAADPEGSDVTFEDGTTLRVESDWAPGQRLARITVDGALIALKVDKITQGFRVRFRGADLKVRVRSPQQARLAGHMPEKLPPDTSKMLLCPMPGLVVTVNVEVGQEVQEGQALCTVEAMKMENILRAEKKAVVTKINAGAGDSLAVDDVIMEFE
ncbi:MAG: biotin/lipoyl-containing protein, partial [Pseudomonadota bacterium]